MATVPTFAHASIQKSSKEVRIVEVVESAMSQSPTPTESFRNAFKPVSIVGGGGEGRDDTIKPRTDSHE